MNKPAQTVMELICWNLEYFFQFKNDSRYNFEKKKKETDICKIISFFVTQKFLQSKFYIVLILPFIKLLQNKVQEKPKKTNNNDTIFCKTRHL